MSTLESLKPLHKLSLMDLVSQAGIDVSDWANYKLGTTRPAANPKYCYKWAFIDPGRQAILNVWHDSLKEEPNGGVFFDWNMRSLVQQRQYAQKARAREFDQVVALAHAQQLPVHVIVLDGPPAKGNVRKVTKRGLDDALWGITSYDQSSGDCMIVRRPAFSKFADQFSLGVTAPEAPEPQQTTGFEYPRSKTVRDNVLESAGGVCEFCREPGFETWDHRIYLETHHIKELSKGGLDTEANVVAICPDDHKRAHFGVDRDAMYSALLEIAARREENAGRA